MDEFLFFPFKMNNHDQNKLVNDFDKKNNHLQKDKLRTQHSVFMKTVLGKDLINNIKNLGFDLKIYRDSVDMYQNSDFICQIDAENIAWDGDLEISDIEETKKRRLFRV